MQVEVSTRILDGCVVLIDAVSGVQCQTKTVWNKIAHRELPAIAFVNKMDRVGADLTRAVESIKDKLQSNPVVLQYPLVDEQHDEFDGFVDLLSFTSFSWPRASETRQKGTMAHIDPITERVREGDTKYEEVVAARRKLVEQLAEIDDALLEKFLEDDIDSVTPQQLLSALRRGCLQRQILPVFCGASLRGKGVQALLDGVLAFLPSPLDRPPITLIPNTELLVGDRVASRHAKQVARAEKDKQTVEVRPGDKDLVALAFKVVHDQMRGMLVYARIFSGRLSAKEMLFNASKQKAERIHQALHINGDDFLTIQEACAGSICCLVGLRNTRSGDTLVADHTSKWKAYVLPGMNIPPPVYSLAIEPESSAKLKELEAALAILSIEDPSLQVELNSSETGQIILRGLGELHLEIVLDKLKRQHKQTVYTGKTYIGYRQTLLNEVSDYVAKYDRVVENKHLFAQFTLTFSLLERPSDEATFEVHDRVLDLLSGEELHALNDCLQNCLLQGPQGYPIVGMNIAVLDFVRESAQITTPGAIRAALSMNIMTVLKDSHNLAMLEPFMHIEIEVPDQFVGEVISDLTGKRRAQEIELRSVTPGVTVIVGKVPLQSILGYATALRSMTQGEGVFSTEYHSHEHVELIHCDL